MQKDKVTFDVIEVLKEITRKHYTKSWQRVRKELRGRDLRLLDYVFEHYYGKDKEIGRSYDLFHIPDCTYFAVQLIKTDETVSPLIVPVMMMHDLGYLVLGKDISVVSQHERIRHMQEGPGMAVEALIKVGGYEAEEARIIVREVATHDNGILGIPTRDPLSLAVIDADRTLVMHPLSFYKDWVGKDWIVEKSQQNDLSLLALFKSRLVHFYDKDDPFPERWGGVPKLSIEEREKMVAARKPSFTALAKEWRNRQFEDRWQEITDDITRDEVTFRRRVEESVLSELKAGSG